MDEKIWIYIIIGAIYVLSKFLKKRGEQPADIPDYEQPKPQRRMEMPTSNPDKPRPLTFEELLREITEGKTVNEQTRPAPKPTYVDYDDNLEDEAKTLEEIPKDYRKKDKIYGLYEEGKKQAFSRPSLEETMKLEDTIVRFEKFKVFAEEEKTNVLQDYVRDLKDPDGFRKAFVLSEVLRPRF
jgi:hypothetical protein